jgi:hypothetical protein
MPGSPEGALSLSPALPPTGGARRAAVAGRSPDKVADQVGGQVDGQVHG